MPHSKLSAGAILVDTFPWFPLVGVSKGKVVILIFDGSTYIPFAEINISPKDPIYPPPKATFLDISI